MKDYNSHEPIYLQIMKRLCRQIVRNELKRGEKLPSIRDLAIQAGVNPNTAQRVYVELERIEIAETRRGLGTFVTENDDRLKQLREQLMHDQINNLIVDMRDMGFTANEIIAGIEHALKEKPEEVIKK